MQRFGNDSQDEKLSVGSQPVAGGADGARVGCGGLDDARPAELR